MLVHLILSQRSLRLSSILFILFTLSYSSAVISTILLQTPQEACLPVGHSVASNRFQSRLKRRVESFVSPLDALRRPWVPGKPRLTHVNFRLLGSMGASAAKALKTVYQTGEFYGRISPGKYAVMLWSFLKDKWCWGKHITFNSLNKVHRSYERFLGKMEKKCYNGCRLFKVRSRILICFPRPIFFSFLSRYRLWKW